MTLLVCVLQLADQWLRANKGSRLNQELFERFVQHLLINQVLQEGQCGATLNNTRHTQPSADLAA